MSRRALWREARRERGLCGHTLPRRRRTCGVLGVLDRLDVLGVLDLLDVLGVLDLLDV
ncbi:hypothetical protein [Streptomyces sp. NPDC021622]|uniref:hypothetical protein n=1 Tax=Streptomyces sp. NPDC021622 TaxID=3155013 RepID=UPI0033FF8C84